MGGEATLGIRWTIGDVSQRGFEALRLSIWGAWRLFGTAADYAVCVNSVPLAEARARAGDLPKTVRWHESDGKLPASLGRFLDDGLAQGVAWKFAPLRLFPNRYELALDNDCILWDLPAALRDWPKQDDATTCVLAEDVRACFGQFAALCSAAPRNTGIRGLPPGFDLEAALLDILELNPVRLVSELDEQGLQVAALSRRATPLVVTVDEVSICSPFPPHRPGLGRCGAHFVGLNPKHISWCYFDRPAVDCIGENWDRHRRDLQRAVGLPASAAVAPSGVRYPRESRLGESA